jgi:hypothetical protein
MAVILAVVALAPMIMAQFLTKPKRKSRGKKRRGRPPR